MRAALKKDYIVFADPLVEQICATNWGDGVGITRKQAARVADIGTTFRGNSSITSFDELKYFTGLWGISENAFRDCSSLISITFPDGLPSLGSYCFWGCSSLTTLSIGTIPNNFTQGSDVFISTNNVTTINAPTFEDWYRYCLGGDITSEYNGNGNPLKTNGHLYINGQELTSKTLSADITVLPKQLFKGLVNLTSVTILGNITTIGAGCFRNCPNLVMDITGEFQSVQTIYHSAFQDSPNISGTVSLPSLTGIGEEAFRNTVGITEVANLGTITEIDGQVFYGTSATKITLPATITTMGYDSCLTRAHAVVVCLATTPPAASGSLIYSAYVPYSADHSILAAYQSASWWSQMASDIHELDQNGNIPT